MTLENQTLHLEVERLQTENAGQRAEIARLKAENKRLQEKCNRMVRSAAIADIHGGRA